MLPTINKRFLIKLVVVLVVLAGALFGTHALQARRIPDSLKAQADRAAELAKDDPKKADTAIHYLRQYLEFRPTDADALEQLAALYRTRGSSPNDLLRVYDKVLIADPARHDTRREALKASLRIARYADAETHARALSKQFPDDSQVWLDLGYALRGLRKYPDARECYETAVKLDPKKPLAYQEYAEFLNNDLRQKDEAKAILDRLIAAVPNDAESHTARGRFFAANGNEAAAVVDARKALEIAPKNADAMLLLGEQLQKKREEVATAADLFREGTKLYPTDARFVRNLSWLEVNRGNHGAAVAALEDGIERVSEKDGFDLLVPLADMLLQMRDFDRPKKMIAKLEARRETDPAKKRTVELQALYLKGRLAMSESAWADAIDVLGKLRNQAGELIGLECQCNLLIAICHQRSGDFDQEEQTLKVLLGRDPNHAAAHVALGQAYLNAGRFEEAVAEYETAARNRFATPDTRAALLPMKAARARASGQPREWAEIDGQLAAFEPTFGQNTSDFALLRAELQAARGATDRAIAVVRAEAQRKASDPRLWSAYSTVGATYAGVSAGLSLLDEAQAVCGDRAELRLARASLYARDPSGLRPLDPLAAQIDMWPEADQNQLLFGLVEIYDRQGDEAGVVRTLRRIAGRYPSNTAVWEGLFDRATRTGDAKTADEARRMIAKLEPVAGKSEPLLTAWEVANGRRTKDAASAADGLVKQYGQSPDRGEVCVALARLKALVGENKEAARLFARAVRLEPLRFGPTQEYLAFLTSQGSDDLTRLLGRLMQDYRWNGERVRRAVRQTVTRVEPAAAKRLLDAVRKPIEQEPDGLGWLGDCYRTAGFETEAMACYEKAVDCPTTTADDWLRLAMRAKDKAEPVLARAKEKLTSPQLYLMTAALFADTPQAPKGWAPELPTAADKKMYAQARLTVKLSRFQKSEAIGVLEDYLTDTKLPAADAAWARRNLAMMLASRGTGSDRTRARELLTREDGSAGTTVDDKRSTAAVLTGLSKQLEGADRDSAIDRAITVMQEVAAASKNPRDRFLLAQLYRTSAGYRSDARAGEFRAKSRVILQELITADRNNPEYYVAALDEMTEPQDQEFARKCADDLIAKYKTDIRVVQAVARYECRAGQPEKALAHVVAYARTADSTPGDLQSRAARAAELLDELTRKPTVRGTEIGRKMTDVAVEKYESLFASTPDAIVAIAGLLSNDGRAAEAFAKIEKHAKFLPSRVKVLAGLAVLRVGGAPTAQFDKVREWLAASLNEEPGSVAVLMNQGELCTLRGDVAGAEGAYKAVLDIDDQHVPALNNLAWILSAKPDATDRALELVDRAVRVIGLTGELLDTRARVKIARKQFDAAERDLQSALHQEETPLRLFHMALVKNGQPTPQTDEARDYFDKAKKRGLREVSVHPADTAAYRELDKARGEVSPR